MKANLQAGFTLLELLVVVTIIGILAAVTFAALDDSRAVARDTKRIADMEAIEQALFLYYQANGTYPQGQPPNTQAGTEIGVGNWIDAELEPYISEVPADPRHDGTTYYYSYDPVHQFAENCSATPSTPAEYATVFGFHRSETRGEISKDVCVGGDMSLDDAHYNVTLFPAAD